MSISTAASHLPSSAFGAFEWLSGISFISRVILALILVAAVTHYQLSCPRSLRHLKQVSPYATLWSYAIRESVDQRIRRLILPFAEQGEGAVAVYMLGKWGVHLLDPALIRTVCLDGNRFPKKNYQEHLHFTFLSGPNVVFSNGEMWKRHSASVKAAFDRDIPVHVFADLAHEVAKRVEDGGVHRWTDLMQRFTLDVVGKAALGHEFDAMAAGSNAEELSFVDHFNRVMSNIATPTRLMFPWLDVLFPRKAVIDDVDALNARYDGLLQEKRGKPGRDILSYLLEDASLSHEELRSNLSILFSAGHDTTSGALSTAVYYLARDPTLQSLVRAEILSVVGTRDPTLADLKDLPLLDATIREALRINSPISLLPARISDTDVILASPTNAYAYAVPAHVPIVPNVYAVHHTSTLYADDTQFDAGRFLPEPEKLAFGTPAHTVATASLYAKPRAGAFIPFGTGPRQCTARQFSLFEQKTLLAIVLSRYEVALPEKSHHAERVLNEFGAFGLSVPCELDIVFRKLGGGSKAK